MILNAHALMDLVHRRPAKGSAPQSLSLAVIPAMPRLDAELEGLPPVRPSIYTAVTHGCYPCRNMHCDAHGWLADDIKRVTREIWCDVM